MPNAIFEVELPDGKILEIEAPADTSPDTIKQRAKQYRYEAMKAEIAKRQGPDLDPTDGMTTLDKLRAGVGKSMVDTARGLGQLVGVVSREDVDRSRVLDAPLMRTKAGMAGNIGGVIGQVLSPGLLLKGAATVPALARAAPAMNAASTAFLPQTVAGAGLQGAAFGAMQPVGTDESRAMNAGLGMAAGAAGAAIPRVAGATLRTAKAPFAGMTRAGAEKNAARVLREAATDVSRLERAAPSSIGTSRTLAEESYDPGIAALQRGVFGQSPGVAGDMAAQRVANNRLRVDAIRQFAGDDAAIEAAESARNAAAKPLRDQAMKATGVDTSRLLSRLDRTIKGLDTRKAVQKPLAEVANLLRRDVPDKERMGLALDQVANYLGSGARRSAADHDAVTQAAKAIRMRGQTPEGALEIIKGIKPKSVAARQAVESAKKLLARAEVGRDDVASLYGVRKSIDDMLAGRYGGDANFAKAASAELMVLKNGLDRAIAKQSPEFGQYLATYRDASRGIDRMKLGQTLLEDGAGNRIRNEMGDFVLTPSAFGRQASDLDRAAVNATGFRKAQAGNILKPQDMAAIRGVEDDLARQYFADTAGRIDSGTQQNVMTMLGQQAERGLLGKVPMAGPVADALRGISNSKMQAALVQALRNPSEARRILGQFPANERRVIEDALFRIGATGGTATVPSVE